MPPLSPENDFDFSSASLTTLEDIDDTTRTPPAPANQHHMVQHKPLHERPARTTVRFAENDTVVDTTHMNDMSQEEKEACWLSCEEIRAIKMDCVGLVGMLDDGMAHMILAEDEDDVCLRGIEQYSGESQERRRTARQQILEEVFAIQDFSHYHLVSGEELIAAVSRKWSESLVQEALELGRSDALCAQLYYCC